MTARVLILSGDRAAFVRILQETVDCPRPDLAAFEEKAIARPAFVHRLVRERRADILCFATKRLDLQRFQVVLAFYLLLSSAGQRFILDESGRTIAVTWPKFLLFSLPRFVIEVLASAGILAASTIRLAFLALSLRRRGAR